MPMTRKRTQEKMDVVDLVSLCIREDILDGNGHSIYRQSRYADKLDAYKGEMNNLCIVHTHAYNNDGSGSPEGIWSLDFHYWVAHKILQIDQNFTWEHKIGKGFQAQAILRATQKWLDENSGTDCA